MKRISFLLVFLFVSFFSFSQKKDTLTIEYCYTRAYETYPLTEQKGLYDRSSALRISNLNKNYLPQVNINGSASLQSDVTELNMELPPPMPAIEGPQLSKDWYKLTLDVNQIIYDGRATWKLKKLEAATLQADRQNVEVELYRIKERINQIYFSIFLLQQNAGILSSAEKIIGARLNEVSAAVEGGTMLTASADALRVELIRITQQITENRIASEAAFRMLSELISEQVSPEADLVLPDVQISSMKFENKRPELQLFGYQQDRVRVLKDMVVTRWNPKLSAFGQAGYGRPGLNMLDNDFTPWWIFGARFTWNIWNWNQNRNERMILDIQSELIKTQQATFDKNLRITAEREISEILRLTGVLQQDDEIIALREKITRSASSQMQNGIITSSEYVSRLNEEIQAKIARELHRVQLVKAKQDYLYTLGKL